MINFKKTAFLTTVLLVLGFYSFAQQEESNPNLKIYRATPDKINDLVHTKLDVKFDYAKAYLYGKAWITLTPHFYPTDSMTLDAKGMDIKTVAMVNGTKNIPLKYTYDSLELKINLDKSYQATDNYTIYIDYTSKPNEFKTKGSQAITDAKGLYFINPDSSVAGKPVQIWTQGETEGSSVWFPTIDHPNQKTTEEIIMTVPSKYVTLSNGALVNQKDNKDGTRTDTWKMDKPHSPYLFMMAVGDFKIYHDKWKDIPVDYYLEPAYAPYAKEIFGKTPEMIDFYFKKLGIDYPWNKYAQIVARDYVSGAMENTTATLHGEYVQQTARELLDGSAGEETIAHELFHQWFGDYVTTESWSNLSVNESFADFSETLWAEHSQGKDAGDAHNYDSMQSYLGSPDAKSKKLIRFYYNDKEDLFDVVTYQKGGRILNMLRNYLGEDAFFKGLNLYLKTNALGNGEAQQLRLALEQVSGKDLNWFFNQWYYGAGNPDLLIDYNWDSSTKTQKIYLSQTQEGEAFKLPMKIDAYLNGKKETHQYWMNSKSDTISYQLPSKPDLINVDADKILLLSKTDHKTIEEFAFQYKNAPLYVDRLEALNGAEKDITNPIALQILIDALKDPYFDLRIKAIDKLDLQDAAIAKKVLPMVINIAKTDQKTLVRAAAIDALSVLKDKSHLILFKEAIKNPSYAIEGAALNAITAIDRNEAMVIAKSLEKDSKGPLAVAIVNTYIVNGSETDFPYVSKAFAEASVQNKFNLIPGFASMIMTANQTENVNDGINQLLKVAEQYKAYGADRYVSVMFTNIKNSKETELVKADARKKADLDTQIKLLDKAIATIKVL
ncbi:MAG: M1 family metallopeptidase [Pelobium sp.]